MSNESGHEVEAVESEPTSPVEAEVAATEEEAGAASDEDDTAADDGASADAGSSATEAEAESAEGSAESDAEEEELPPLVPVLEASLFASAEAVPLTRLTRVLGAWSRKQVVAGLKELAERQEREGSGVRVVETAGGYQLRSVSDYAPWVRKFFTEKPPRLSRAVLETLAIVAYRQPATRGEVEAVRGVNCDAVLGALTARGLIQVIGRRQSPGRPVEYGTTQEFLELFSLKELADLPPLPDPSSLANLIEESRAEEEAAANEESAADADAEDPGHSDVLADATTEPEVDGISDEQEAAADQSEEAVFGGDGGAASEDPEPGGDRVEAVGGGVDSRGAGSGQREGGPRAGGEG